MTRIDGDVRSKQPSQALHRRRLVAGFAAAALVLFLAACTEEDGTGPVPGPLAGRAFIVNSVAGTLSVVGRGADGRLAAQNDAVELGPASTAVALAVGDGVVAVPDGATSRLLVFDEATLAPRCEAALPAGSSPNGVAISDGKAYVSLLISGAVARVDLATCTVEQMGPAGPAPADVEVLDGKVLVVVSNIDLLGPGFPPPRLGPGYVAFLDAQTLTLQDTVGTGGFNPQFAALDRDGDLLVVNTADFGGGNSSLAVLDPVSRRFSAAFPIGDSAVDLAVSPSNLVYVSSFSDGLYVFDASANRVVRGVSNPLFAPGPSGARRGSSGVAVDRRGNVLSIFPDNFAVPGRVFLFDSDGALVDSVAVGIGPVGVQVETSARPD
jgi:streptogramin lyase